MSDAIPDATKPDQANATAGKAEYKSVDLIPHVSQSDHFDLETGVQEG